jgi:pimeloyl-ACP methyl ester carboxylesterase
MMKLTQRIIRTFFSAVSPVFPRLAGKLAFELFQHPHAKKTRSRELALFEHFRERRISRPDEDMFVYEKGPEDGYPIILVHGWESNPGSMFAIADAFQRCGYRVLVIGLPAHGRSGLKKTNMVHASRYLKDFLEKEGFQNRCFSMVTHSFGSAASTIALMESGIQVDSLVFLTSPDRIMDIFDNFRDMIKLGNRAYAHLLSKTESMVHYKLVNFNISAFLTKVRFKSLVVLHDLEDKVLPFKNAQAIKKAVPKSELIELREKGHYRLLWDDEVIGIVVKKFNIEPIV